MNLEFNAMIIGSFVFRDEGDGCLVSKYVNNGQDTPYVESCKLKEKIISPWEFDGVYDTVWIEEKSKRVRGELKIKKRDNADVYELSWKNLTTEVFKGIGMIYQDLLVGCYWEVLNES
jgi:hypothetical protein